MADSKITALTAITTVNPATYPLVIVDTSDTSMAGTGTTKKVTTNQLLGAGGTATLASATISGDLTVDTSTLKVDSANNFVGVGTTTGVNLAAGRGNLTIGGSSSAILNLSIGAVDTGYVIHDGTSIYLVNRIAAGSLSFSTNSTERLRIDSSGNVGIGVTPSAWAAGTYKSLQIGQSSSISAGVASELVVVGSNCYFDTTDSRWERITSGYTSQYYQTGGTHVWRIGGTAGANTDCSFTQAMTLDASGNLLVKKTASSGTTLGVELLATGQINGAAANADNLNIYNTTAAAYRFYVSAAGTVFATNTTISAISDARFKENVQDIDVGLGAILALKPRKFDWKDGKGKNIKGDRGFIAQEFETVFPNLIDEWKENAPEGEAPYKSVRQDLIPVLVKAIQELAARVQTLETR